MTSRRANCSCGQLEVETSGEPIRVSVCHCLACQRRTGSAFGYQARFPREQITIRGRSSQYTRVADSGNRLTYHFCPECGATLHYGLDHAPEIVAIPVGAFADEDFPPPKFSIYEARKHQWVGVNCEVEHQD